MLSTSEAAKYLSVGRGAIFQAIKFKRIEAKKIEGKWSISIDSLNEYVKNRHTRDKNKLIFDFDKGIYSIKESSKFLNCDIQHIYHACRYKKINAIRKNHYWVISVDELIRYRQELHNKKRKKAEKIKKKRVRNVFRNKCYCEGCGKEVDQKISLLRGISS